jgi:hypothetical protein
MGRMNGLDNTHEWREARGGILVEVLDHDVEERVAQGLDRGRTQHGGFRLPRSNKSRVSYSEPPGVGKEWGPTSMSTSSPRESVSRSGWKSNASRFRSERTRCS